MYQNKLLLAVLLGAASCQTPTPKIPKSEPLSISFVAKIGDRPFACGETYQNLGATKTTFQPMDLRFYVYDVRLVSARGVETPFVLSSDNVFQKDGVALLDFEDQKGLCSNGTPALHTQLTGTTAATDAVGLRFRIGVPEAKNHQDASLAEAPLNDLGLFWSWSFGYLFMRVEGKTTGLPQGYNLHLGSNNCTPIEDGKPNHFQCANQNVAEVYIERIDLKRDRLIVDLAALFLDSNLDTNTADTAAGCMSFPDDPDCIKPFEQLGLAFGDQPAKPAGRAFFRVE